MRVAFVTETYPPEVNGVATTTQQFVEGLHRLGHDVQLVRPRQRLADIDINSGSAVPPFDQVLVRSLPIPKYPHLRMGAPAWLKLMRLWSRRRPDVVHLATEGPLGWSALQVARHLQLPVTSDFRTNFHAYSQHYGMGWLNRPIMAYLRRFHNRTACTMVPTEALKRQLELSGFRSLTVVPRGVDTQRFSPERRSDALRARWGVLPDDLVVTCVGRLAPEKNLKVLIAAYQAIRAAQPRARLLLVGDGPMRAALRAECPDAVFAGQRSGRDLAAHYASADLFLFPSLTETFGNVTTEALASGLPVLAFDHAAAGQLIRSGDNGVLVPADDAADFVSRAVALAVDARLRQSIAPRALATARALGWDRVVMSFEAQLAAACGAAIALSTPATPPTPATPAALGAREMGPWVSAVE